MTNKKDPILELQINTVPGLEDKEENLDEEDIFDRDCDYDRDIPDSDYMEYINKEVNEINKRNEK